MVFLEFEKPLEAGDWMYRQLFWEAGAVGQSLYLEAEAAGVVGVRGGVDAPHREHLVGRRCGQDRQLDRRPAAERRRRVDEQRRVRPRLGRRELQRGQQGGELGVGVGDDVGEDQRAGEALDPLRGEVADGLHR